MKLAQTLTALCVILAATPALAQTTGVGTDAGSDRSTGTNRSNDNTTTQTLENKRGAGIGTTINAANIVLPGMAALPAGDPLLAADDLGAGLTICKVAQGYRDDVLKAANAEFEAGRTFQKDKDVKNYRDLTSYALGDTVTFNDRRNDFDKQRDDFERRFKNLPPLEFLNGDYKVVDLGHIKEGWIGLTGPGIEKGKEKMWRPSTYTDQRQYPVSVSVTVTNDPERNALIEKAKAAWAALTPEAAAPICVGFVTRTFIASNQIGWSVPENAMGVWARAATMENLVFLEMARDIATRIQAVKYKDNAVATQHATLIATQIAPVYVQKYKEIVAATHEGKDIKIVTDGTGKCGQGWSATVQGANYDFCGTQHGFDISAAGGKWGGEGWLAGAKTEVSFSQSGSATVTEADSVLHSSTAGFTQSVKTIFGLGK